MGFANERYRKLGLRVEATEGTLDTGGAYPVVYVDSLSPSFVDTFLGDPRTIGAGESQGEATVLTAYDLTTPSALAYSDCRPLVARAFRADFPTAVSIIGTSDIIMASGATHLDNTTGFQIQSTAGAFDSLINYDGASSNGSEGLMMRNINWDDAANNRWRRIKAVHETSGAKIDVAQGWTGTATGAPLVAGAAAAATAQSPTIAIGSSIRNRPARSTGDKSVSALIQATDLSSNGVFYGGYGLVANDLTFTYGNDKGVGVNVTWQGRGAIRLADSDPTSQGYATATTPYERLDAGNHLHLLAFVTATKPTVLSSFNVTGSAFTLNGNNAPIDDVGGITTRAGIDRGDHAITGGTVDYRHRDDDARCVELAMLGDPPTKETPEWVAIFTDAAGNSVVPSVLKCNLSQTGPSSATGGQVVYSGKPLTSTSRTCIWQEFAAAS